MCVNLALFSRYTKVDLDLFLCARENATTGFLPDRFRADFESGFGVLGVSVRHRLRSKGCMQIDDWNPKPP